MITKKVHRHVTSVIVNKLEIIYATEAWILSFTAFEIYVQQKKLYPLFY